MPATTAQTRRKPYRRPAHPGTAWLQAAVVLGAAAVVVGVMLAAAANGASGGPAQVGAPMPNFRLTSVTGAQVQLSDYAGRPVLVNAWATWCPPCRAEMPALHAYYAAHAAEGLVLLAVNAGEDRAPVAAFAEQHGLTFPVLLDPATQTLDRLGVRSYPVTIVVGRDGVVRRIHLGMFTPESLEAEVTPLLN